VARPRLVLTATATPRPPEPEGHRRQRQHRLSMTEITKLIKKYEQHASVKDLAKQFGIHCLTVTALLKRHGIEPRQVGPTDEQVADACHIYPAGWSLSLLGERYGIDSTTVWRALRAAGVGTRPPSTGG
jgi:hypothetical protein